MAIVTDATAAGLYEFGALAAVLLPTRPLIERFGLAEPEEGSRMHGQIDAVLHHDPANCNKLIVTGTLTAETPEETQVPVKKIVAALTINGGAQVHCNTNNDKYGNPLYASLAGTPWTMDAATPDHGAATSDATAYDVNNGILKNWTQPTPPIQVMP